MLGYPHRLEAGTRRIDPDHQRQQIADWRLAPRVGIRACISGRFWPGAEMQFKQFAQRPDGLQIFLADPRAQAPAQDRTGMYGPPPFCKRNMRMAEVVCVNVSGLCWSSDLLA